MSNAEQPIPEEINASSSSDASSADHAQPQELLPPILLDETDASNLCSLPYNCYFESTKEAMGVRGRIGNLVASNEAGNDVAYHIPGMPPIGEIRIDEFGRDLTPPGLYSMRPQLGPESTLIRTRAKKFWKDPEATFDQFYEAFSRIPEPPKSEEEQRRLVESFFVEFHAFEAQERLTCPRLSSSPAEAFHAQFQFLEMAAASDWRVLIEQRRTSLSPEQAPARIWPNYYAPPPSPERGPTTLASSQDGRATAGLTAGERRPSQGQGINAGGRSALNMYDGTHLSARSLDVGSRPPASQSHGHQGVVQGQPHRLRSSHPCGPNTQRRCPGQQSADESAVLEDQPMIPGSGGRTPRQSDFQRSHFGATGVWRYPTVGRRPRGI